MSERRAREWIRYSGVGLELAGATAGLTLLGYWVDSRWGTSPWGMIVGVFIGIVGGLYNLVRESLQAVHEAQAEDAEAQEPEHKGRD